MPLAEARERILAAAEPLTAPEESDLDGALGRVLAGDLRAPQDVPPFDNSAMDGYALRAADAAPGATLPVSQRIAAGRAGTELQPGTAARIFTGAPLPPGADAVAIQEDCHCEGGLVTLGTGVRRGQNVRRRGEDMAAGSVALSAGRRLRPQDIGLIASLGLSRVPVRTPLRVAVLATGDELRPPGSGPLEPGQIYNSNGAMLAALLRALGMQVVDGGRVPDDAAATRSALARAAADADVVLSSGGVSVGEEDHVRAQVESLGRLDLWKIAIKPGKPLAFGRIGETPFIGLPGNPSSVFVTFALLARPYLLACQGARERELPALTARARFESARAGSRTEFLRVRLQAEGEGLAADLYPNQSSGVLRSVCDADALAVIPAGTTLRCGEAVRVLLLDALTR
jgi:molybdopterin molybdotransferase